MAMSNGLQNYWCSQDPVLYFQSTGDTLCGWDATCVWPLARSLCVKGGWHLYKVHAYTKSIYVRSGLCATRLYLSSNGGPRDMMWGFSFQWFWMEWLVQGPSDTPSIVHDWLSRLWWDWCLCDWSLIHSFQILRWGVRSVS